MSKNIRQLTKGGEQFYPQTHIAGLVGYGENGKAIDDEPTAGSDNLVKSGGVQNELALGAVYDVSAKNPIAGPNNDGKFESLSALLSDASLNALIPTAVRRGGMSIKFVQSSDNKYVKFFCNSLTFTTDVTQWQGVDDEPIEGSESLVKSNGVNRAIAKLEPTVEENVGVDKLFRVSNNIYSINLSTYKRTENCFSVADYVIDPTLETTTRIHRLCFVIPFDTIDDLDFKVDKVLSVKNENNVEIGDMSQYMYMSHYEYCDWGGTDGTNKKSINKTKTIKEWLNDSIVSENLKNQILTKKKVYIYCMAMGSNRFPANSTSIYVHAELRRLFSGHVTADTLTDTLKQNFTNEICSYSDVEPIANSDKLLKSNGTSRAIAKLEPTIGQSIGERAIIRQMYATFACNAVGGTITAQKKYNGFSVADFDYNIEGQEQVDTILRLSFAIPFDGLDDLDFKVDFVSAITTPDGVKIKDNTNFYMAYRDIQDWSGDYITRVTINKNKSLKENLANPNIQQSFFDNLLINKVLYIFVVGQSVKVEDKARFPGLTSVHVHGELYRVFDGDVTANKITNELKEEIKEYIDGHSSIKLNLISLGDSLGSGWLNEAYVKLELENVFNISAGGTTSGAGSKNNAFYRILKLEDENLIEGDGSDTIVVIENVNDFYTVPSNIDAAIAADKAVMPKHIILSDILSTEFTSAALDTVPQNKREVGAFLQVLTTANGKKLTITDLPTVEGDIRLVVGWQGSSVTATIHVVPQSTDELTLAYVKEKILEVNYGDITVSDGGDNNILFSLGNNAWETNVSFTGISNTGMQCTITAVSDAHGSLLKYFKGTSVSDWTNVSEWDNASSISLTSAWKGIIQYILTNYPECRIVIAGFPRHNVKASDYLQEDGTYDIEAWKATSNEIGLVNLLEFQEKIAKFFNIAFVNVDKESNITLSNISNFYYDNNVHPKQNGYNRWGDVISAFIRSRIV